VVKIAFYRFEINSAAQKIGPSEFAEGRFVFGVSARSFKCAS
jgi:hypothetical protein